MIVTPALRRMTVCAALAAATAAVAQETPVVQRSSSPTGIRLHGETGIESGGRTQQTGAGDTNVAKSAAAESTRSGNQIQGNTRIDARAAKLNTIAVGKGNAAGNSVGSIGGK